MYRQGFVFKSYLFLCVHVYAVCAYVYMQVCWHMHMLMYGLKVCSQHLLLQLSTLFARAWCIPAAVPPGQEASLPQGSPSR